MIADDSQGAHGAHFLPTALRTLRRQWGPDVLIVEVDSGAMHVLNASAVSVLDACNGRRSVGQIVAYLIDESGLRFDDLELQVQDTLEQLAAGNLVRWQQNF